LTGETLAASATFGVLPGVAPESLDIDGHPLTISLRPT
jgi:hypothetical protein